MSPSPRRDAGFASSYFADRFGQRRSGVDELFPALLRPMLVLILVFLSGVLGYILVEDQSILEAVYTTTIILSTVGLGASRLSDLSHGGMVFTVILIWGGVGTVAYILTQVVGFVVSGELNMVVRARRMERVIGSLHGHVVLCGAEESAEQALAELRDRDVPVVIVCDDTEHLSHVRTRFGEVLVVDGPPTDADTLNRANVTAAKALLACLDTDAETLFLVLTARELAPELLIVAQASDPDSVQKLRKVGADHVVAPELIAGTRMASVALRPTALAFLDVLTKPGEEALRLEEVVIPDGSRWSGQTLAEVKIPSHTNLLVMGMRRKDVDTFVFNPSAKEKLQGGDSLIVLGTTEQRGKLETLLAEEGSS